MDRRENNEEFGGCSPSRTHTTPLTCHLELITPRARSNYQNRGTSIGRLLSTPTPSVDSDLSETLSDNGTLNSSEMLDLLDVIAQRRIQQYLEQDSFWDPDLSTGEAQETGRSNGYWQSLGTWNNAIRQYEFCITDPCVQFLVTMQSQLLSYVQQKSIGVQLELGNLDEHGMKQDCWSLTLRIPGPSFGVATEVRQMLLSMNFEEVSTYPISLDGLTDIQSEWNSKDHLPVYVPKDSGSRATFIPESGIQSWTKRQRRRY